MLTETNANKNKAIPVGNLDFYLCPKNATNTIRYCSYLFNGGKKEISDYRNESISTGAMSGYKILQLGNKANSKIEYNNERTDSIKIAVIRDPLDRFISALQWVNYKYKLNLTLEEAVNKVPNDIHFYPQFHYYGEQASKYDHLIYANNITSLIFQLTGKDMGNIHKGKNPKPVAYEITKDIEFKINSLYKKDFDLGYC